MFDSSPHLVEVRERIRINGNPLEKEKFTEYFWQCLDRLEASSVSLYFMKFTSLAKHMYSPMDVSHDLICCSPVQICCFYQQ